MQHVPPGDGTLIAFHEVGSGAPVVIVGGAFSTAEAGEPLAAALAAAGLRGVTVDRRARGNSSDTAHTCRFAKRRTSRLSSTRSAGRRRWSATPPAPSSPCSPPRRACP